MSFVATSTSLTTPSTPSATSSAHSGPPAPPSKPFAPAAPATQRRPRSATLVAAHSRCALPAPPVAPTHLALSDCSDLSDDSRVAASRRPTMQPSAATPAPVAAALVSKPGAKPVALSAATSTSSSSSSSAASSASSSASSSSSTSTAPPNSTSSAAPTMRAAAPPLSQPLLCAVAAVAPPPHIAKPSHLHPTGPLSGSVKKARPAHKLAKTPGESRYWTPSEHKLFVEALLKFGPKNLKAISAHVGTRNMIQCRTHEQKYFLRLMRKAQRETMLRNGELDHVPDAASRPLSHQKVVYSLPSSCGISLLCAVGEEMARSLQE